MALRIRPAVQADAPGVVRVIRAVYDEYGFTWEVEGYHADLYDLEGHYHRKGHRFYIAEDEGSEIKGTAALRLFDPIVGPPMIAIGVSGKLRIGGCDCSLDRLYVLPSARRQGIGIALSQKVIDDARALRRRRMEIWSDKRFVDAHRLFGRLGAVQIADRILDDPDHSPEWGLALEL